MADQTSINIDALHTEIKQLRADFAEIAETIREIASVAGTRQQGQAPSEKVWTEVKRQTGGIGREIQEKPIGTALTIFGAGVLLGLLLNARRD